ncbi:MAG: hypothetical protein CUN55_12220 [Phototrophicales bacterium]|nr:MAG: hypothetical protein CUN55_12220 [Phototrophicales bacterium]
MKLTFLGGADEVGASSTLIDIAGKKLLVDVGIRISPKTVRGISGDQLPDLQQISDVGGPDYILVTHAHTDHTGALPLVLEQYPDVPVLATEPTIALTKTLQADAQRIMADRHEQEGELPLFDEIAVERLLNAFQAVQLRQTISLGENLQVTYYASGHILGAAMLYIESDEGILLMSGDLSLTEQRAVVKADIPRLKADFLVMESTYGGRLHANRAAEEKRLIETLKRIIERGGKAIIPAFALGRAQEVLQILHAYRDEIDVPIWVDGMVRAVCQTYHLHRDMLPSGTQKTIKEDEHLFFRNKIKPVQSRVQREDIARGPESCVIVSSSGMLTGGPSAAYARWLAEEEANGIFLTGYQDEESPGRFIQKAIADHDAGKVVHLRLDDSEVHLRCELGTYSLSAHADEAELISIAESIGAQHIALVHGDDFARKSIASRLRERQKHVHMPQSGTSIEISFTKRPWAIGLKNVRAGTQTVPLDPQKLWESLKDQAGSFLSARELAKAWWGDHERYQEVIETLEHDGVYFAQNWRRKDTFQVRSEEKVARTLRQREIIAKNEGLLNKLIVVHDVNGRAKIGIVREVFADSFKLFVAKSKAKQYPADSLVWVIADWDTFPDKNPNKGFLSQLNDISDRAQALKDVLLPFEKRNLIALNGKPVLPQDLIPETLPEGVSRELALLAIVYALAVDGAVWHEDGLLPRQVSRSEPMEMNLARKTALSFFDEDARLRKVGLNLNTHQMVLYFDFPSVAKQRYADQIELVEQHTNWQVVVSEDVNQQALGSVLYELLPTDARVTKGPSFYLDRQQVRVELEGVKDMETLQNAYKSVTGFDLVVNEQESANNTETSKTTIKSSVTTKDKMEINAAYGLIRSALDQFGLYKTSLKQGRIVLSFISPQVGARHVDLIQELAAQTGYDIVIHPHPNQNAIIQVATQLLAKANANIVKGPSVFIDRAEVGVKIAAPLPDEVAQTVVNQFEENTGYRLLIEVQD